MDVQLIARDPHALQQPAGVDIIQALERVVAMQEQYQLDSRDVRTVLVIAQNHTPILDAITQPQLLHGDLWHQNLLVEWINATPQIVGVLDTGFASWVDPPYDWTLIRLSLRPPTESAAFWDTYGRLDPSVAAQFRTMIYQARSLGVSLIETLRLQQTEGHIWVGRKLHEITARLQSIDM